MPQAAPFWADFGRGMVDCVVGNSQVGIEYYMNVGTRTAPRMVSPPVNMTNPFGGIDASDLSEIPMIGHFNAI